MSGPLILAQAAPASDLLDVFSGYTGEVLFRGLVDAPAGGSSVLGLLGWIFTAGGAAAVLWGFVARSASEGSGDRLGLMARMAVVLALIPAGPVLVRACMEAADSIQARTTGSPGTLARTCEKAALAMPELGALVDTLRSGALAPGSGQAPVGAPGGPASSAPPPGGDGTVLGFLEAQGRALWGAAGAAVPAAGSWSAMARILSLAAAGQAVMTKCGLMALVLEPLVLLLQFAGALIWLMAQVRYFLAVTGTMALPLFVGLYAMPGGHPARAVARGYVMNVLSVTLWPVAWALGHTGTIGLFNALVALIAGTSRVPDIAAALQWSALAAQGTATEAQLAGFDQALGNWFMGDVSALLSVLVGAVGFAAWVLSVSILGPVCLHRLLTTGALVMAELGRGAGRLGTSVAGAAASVVPVKGLIVGHMATTASKAAASGLGGPGGSGPGASLGVTERAQPVETGRCPTFPPGLSGSGRRASMAAAAEGGQPS